MQPGKGGRGGGKAEASGAGGGSAELSKHLGALQVAAGQHVSSRSAQVRRPRPPRAAAAAPGASALDAVFPPAPLFRVAPCVSLCAGGLKVSSETS